MDSLGVLSDKDLNYLWLPLSHSFGKVMLALPLVIGFPTVIDGRVDKIVENLAVIRPTIMGAVPRIFEKVHGRINEMMAKEGGVKKTLFDWAVGVGVEVSRTKQAGKAVSPLLNGQYKLADKLVLSKIRDRFGGRLRFFISGSAALDREIAQWFDAIGVVVLEGYGLTETSAASVLNRPNAYRFGTVGWTFPETEVKIAGDGEILLKDLERGSLMRQRAPILEQRLKRDRCSISHVSMGRGWTWRHLVAQNHQFAVRGRADDLKPLVAAGQMAGLHAIPLQRDRSWPAASCETTIH
jgi:acyl-CoA synthetase (AMP-forming)/AMP-acid ligase II